MNTMDKLFRGVDNSLGLLVFSNILTIFFAVTQNWDLLTVMWIYWFQSVIIGFFNFLRIIKLKESCIEESKKSNGKHPIPIKVRKYIIAFFFLFHFGGFHFVYMIFLIIFQMEASDTDSSGATYFLLAILSFLIAHIFSHFNNRKIDESKKQNLGLLMYYPYARIIPMHFMIMFGVFINAGLILFLSLKTIADVIMHIKDEKLSSK